MKLIYLAILSVFILGNTFISAATISETWLGGNSSNDMLDPSNWTNGITPNDVATFQSALPSNRNPNLSTTEIFNINTFSFPSLTPNNAFTFSINGAGSQLNFFITGVDVNNNNIQTFNVTNNGSISFHNNSSAFVGSGAPPFYSLNSGHIAFHNHSLAGNANFLLSNHSEIDFNNHSSAQNGTFTLNQSDLFFSNNAFGGTGNFLTSNGSFIDFRNDSDAQSATLHATDNDLIRFSGTSNMNNATSILENNSELFYASTTSQTVTTASVTLLSGSFMDFAGAIDLSIGSLSGDNTSLLALGNVHFQTGTTNTDSLFAGAITGPGGIFDKVGTGTFTYAGLATNTGGVNVLGGTFVLNGSITGSDVTVAKGATLKGIGSIHNGNLSVSGTISPGNSIGTLSVNNGSYAQLDGSFYNAEINGLGASDLIDVTGVGSTATIGANTTVIVSSPDGTFLVGSQYNYLILHADEGVIGTYTTAVQNISPFLTPRLFYVPAGAATDILVNLTTNFTLFAATDPEACIATQLDALSLDDPTLEQEEFLVALASLSTVEDLQSALDLIVGDPYTYTSQIAEYTDYRFGRRIFSAVRELLRPTDCSWDDSCPSFEVWARGEYDHAKINSSPHVPGLKDNSWDISAGGHTCAYPGLVLGVAGNYSTDNLKFFRGSENNKLQSAQGALYGVYQTSHIYLFSNLILGETWSDNFKRDITFGSFSRQTKGKPRIFHGKYYTEIGVEVGRDCFFFEPFIGADVGWFSRNRFTESGADSLNLSINRKNSTYFDTYFGFHFLGALCDFLNINGDLLWQHRYGSFRGGIDSSLIDSFTFCHVDGNDIGRDGLVGTVNFSTCSCNGWEFYAEFNGQQWARMSSYGFTLGLNYLW